MGDVEGCAHVAWACIALCLVWTFVYLGTDSEWLAWAAVAWKLS